MKECTDAVDAMGRNVRRCFDQLVIDVNPDHGPDWLDRIIYAERVRKPAVVTDRQHLRAALNALTALVD